MTIRYRSGYWRPIRFRGGILTVTAMFAAAPMTFAQTPAKAAHDQVTFTQVTFTKDIAPILQRSCQNCHRTESMAPMSLVSYQDARPWAKAIKQKVVQREMPPWFVDKNIGIRDFKDDPSLTDKEIATISAWVDSGAPQGNPADMPPPRKFEDVDQWHIGKPDLIVSMPVCIHGQAAELRLVGQLRSGLRTYRGPIHKSRRDKAVARRRNQSGSSRGDQFSF